MDIGLLFADDNSGAAIVEGTSLAVITGPPGSGKSSLAFQAAVSIASQGGSALVLVQQQRVQSALPAPLRPLADLPEALLGRIDFVYVDTISAACSALGSLGTAASCAQGIPSLIILEDGGLTPQLDTRAASALIAVGAATAAAFPGTSLLVVSDAPPLDVGAVGRFPYAVAQRWLHCLLAPHGPQWSATFTPVVSGIADPRRTHTMTYRRLEDSMEITSPLRRTAGPVGQ